MMATLPLRQSFSYPAMLMEERDVKETKDDLNHSTALVQAVRTLFAKREGCGRTAVSDDRCGNRLRSTRNRRGVSSRTAVGTTGEAKTSNRERSIQYCNMYFVH